MIRQREKLILLRGYKLAMIAYYDRLAMCADGVSTGPITDIVLSHVDGPPGEATEFLNDMKAKFLGAPIHYWAQRSCRPEIISQEEKMSTPIADDASVIRQRIREIQREESRQTDSCSSGFHEYVWSSHRQKWHCEYCDREKPE